VTCGRPMACSTAQSIARLQPALAPMGPLTIGRLEDTIMAAQNRVSGSMLALDRPKITEQALAAFLRLNLAGGDASPSTIRAHLSHFRQFRTWCDEQCIVPAMATVDDLKAYRRHLVEMPYTDRRSGRQRHYTRATVARKLETLRRVYDAATSWGLRPDNPAAGLKAPRDATRLDDLTRFLPLARFQALLDSPDNSGIKGRRDRAILALMGYHGLRVSSVAGLSMDGVDLDADPPTLRVLSKGGKQQVVYLTEHTAAILADWLATRDQAARLSEPCTFVALDHRTRGRGMTSRALRYLVDGYLARLGLKGEGVSCHSLRHSFATWSLAGGAKLLAVSDALGHAQVTTTQRYAKIADHIRENPTRYLEGLLNREAG